MLHIHRQGAVPYTELHPENEEDVKYLREQYPHLQPCQFVCIADPPPKISSFKWAVQQWLRDAGA